MSSKRMRRKRNNPATSSMTVIEAHQFILRDLKGNIRGQLGCAADGSPQIQFMAPDESPQLRVGVCSGVPGVALIDSKGIHRAMLTLDEDDDSVVLSLQGADGQPRVTVSHSHDGSQVLFSDANGQPRLCVASSSRGESVVQLSDAAGGIGAGLGYFAERGTLALTEGSGKDRVELHMDVNSTHLVTSAEGPGENHCVCSREGAAGAEHVPEDPTPPCPSGPDPSRN